MSSRTTIALAAAIVLGTAVTASAATVHRRASDADSATGGPDALRGIYPIVATITAEGWQRVSDEHLASVFEEIATEVRAR